MNFSRLTFSSSYTQATFECGVSAMRCGTSRHVACFHAVISCFYFLFSRLTGSRLAYCLQLLTFHMRRSIVSSSALDTFVWSSKWNRQPTFIRWLEARHTWDSITLATWFKDDAACTSYMSQIIQLLCNNNRFCGLKEIKNVNWDDVESSYRPALKKIFIIICCVHRLRLHNSTNSGCKKTSDMCLMCASVSTKVVGLGKVKKLLANHWQLWESNSSLFAANILALLALTQSTFAK